MKDKGRKAINKKNQVLEKLSIKYVPIDSIKPNEYNPNRQSDHDFELLLRSMREDGFTQPVLCQKETKEIVDGEHRWRAARDLGFKEIPVVFVEMTTEQMRISTLRHNRARGSENIELSAQVLRDLQQLGALDWAQDSLMLTDIELNRLLEDISAPEALAGEEFSQAWLPDNVNPGDMTGIEQRTVDDLSKDSTVDTYMSKDAIDTARDREKRIKEAKTLEEQEMAQKDRDLYRLSLVFSGEQGKIVKGVLGKAPAEKILGWCKQEHEAQIN